MDKNKLKHIKEKTSKPFTYYSRLLKQKNDDKRIDTLSEEEISILKSVYNNVERTKK